MIVSATSSRVNIAAATAAQRSRRRLLTAAYRAVEMAGTAKTTWWKSKTTPASTPQKRRYAPWKASPAMLPRRCAPQR